MGFILSGAPDRLLPLPDVPANGLPAMARIMQILNSAAYKFVALHQLPDFKTARLQALQTGATKGAVLIAEEGSKLFLAAVSMAIHDFLAWLQLDLRFLNLDTHEGGSSAQPFTTACWSGSSLKSCA